MAPKQREREVVPFGFLPSSSSHHIGRSPDHCRTILVYGACLAHLMALGWTFSHARYSFFASEMVMSVPWLLFDLYTPFACAHLPDPLWTFTLTSLAVSVGAP